MSKLHGFRRGEETIRITHLPDHKKPVLLIGNGGRYRKIASFDSEECAEEFCKLLEEWFSITAGSKAKQFNVGTVITNGEIYASGNGKDVRISCVLKDAEEMDNRDIGAWLGSVVKEFIAESEGQNEEKKI